MNTYAIMNLVLENNTVKITGNDTPVIATALILGVNNPNVFSLEVKEDWKGVKTAYVNGTRLGTSKDLQEACFQAIKFMSVLY